MKKHNNILPTRGGVDENGLMLEGMGAAHEKKAKNWRKFYILDHFVIQKSTLLVLMILVNCGKIKDENFQFRFFLIFFFFCLFLFLFFFFFFPFFFSSSSSSSFSSSSSSSSSQSGKNQKLYSVTKYYAN